MIAVDANLLLHAYDESSSRHRQASTWWEGVLNEEEPVMLPWASILAFLRISTNPSIFASPLSMDEAVEIVDSWLERPNLDVLGPGERHWNVLKESLTAGQVRGAMVTDAHLAALALEHGCILATTDRDFARFPALRFRNPLEA